MSITTLRPAADRQPSSGVGVVILSPPASGKSYFCLRSQGRAIDGDHIIKDALGWPVYKVEAPWWNDDKIAREVGRDNWTALITASRVLNKPVFFAGPPILASNCIIGKVVPDEQLLLQRWKRRAIEEGRPRPESEAALLRGLRTIADGPGTAFSGFAEALSWAENILAGPSNGRSATVLAALDSGPQVARLSYGRVDGVPAARFFDGEHELFIRCDDLGEPLPHVSEGNFEAGNLAPELMTVLQNTVRPLPPTERFGPPKQKATQWHQPLETIEGDPNVENLPRDR